jgi:hypothetical protein
MAVPPRKKPTPRVTAVNVSDLSLLGLIVATPLEHAKTEAHTAQLHRDTQLD